jgi:hypothetical protein
VNRKFAANPSAILDAGCADVSRQNIGGTLRLSPTDKENAEQQ